MLKKALKMQSLLVILLSLCVFLLPVDSSREDFDSGGMLVKPSMVKRGERKRLMVSEYGEISAVDIITSGKRGSFHLEFMTLEPNSLFLPVLLHADMVFYVNTGSGKLSWAEDGKAMRRMDIKKGDVYRLHAGSIFFVQSDLETERQKLRIYSIYSNTDEDIYVPALGAYSSISDLVVGFDRKMLTSAFNVPDDVVEEILSAKRAAGIVHALPEKKKSIFKEIEDRLVKALIGNTDGPFYDFSVGKKRSKTYNILEADPDFENCNGWSVTVDRKDLKSLKHSNIGIFMVNLTKGSMMGPHWNPMATEIGIVLQGRGMIRVVCASNANETKCKNMRFRVKEGDVFSVPRFHPMAQMSFNNDTFVFMGFSTSTRKNYPQFLAGKSSVLQTLNRDILALSFNVTNTTIDALLSPQDEAIILDCTSCAEEEEMKMVREWEEEEAREREEERRRREEEEERKRKEEERKREEEEERRKREEEERRRKEEEERKREEEERKQKEEEERKREEERRQREEEEERRKREEEERRKREEEEEEREREEEEAAKKREGEAEREREREEAEARREEEHRKREERARREQEEARREQEERKRQRRQREKEEQARKERERKREEEEEGEGQPEEDKRRRRRSIAARRFWKA